MRLPVAPATAPARLWLAAVASAAVIGGAYLLESHGRTWAAAGLVAAGVGGRAPPVLSASRARSRPRQGGGDQGAPPTPPPWCWPAPPRSTECPTPRGYGARP